MLRRSACVPQPASREHRSADPCKQPPRSHGAHQRRRGRGGPAARRRRRREDGAPRPHRRSTPVGTLAHDRRPGARTRRARRRVPGGAHDVAAGDPHAEPDRPRPRRPGAHGLGGRVGRARDAAHPLHLFDSNAFYPHPLSLAFSDSLLGYGPAAWFGSGTVAALVRYNLLFLFAWSLCLRRRLPARPRARARATRGGRRRDRLRLRPLPRHRGGAPARDLLRRHPAGAVPAAARLPPRLARAWCWRAGSSPPGR